MTDDEKINLQYEKIAKYVFEECCKNEVMYGIFGLDIPEEVKNMRHEIPRGDSND